ncbi:MAG: hypothetical protein ACRDPY_49645 [Streptosporangiaceae bacterium]
MTAPAMLRSELSRHGLLEFVNVHAIVVSPPGGSREDRASVSE